MTKPLPPDQKIPPLRVTIRGVTYETVRKAADALGVKPNTIIIALRKGRLDAVGIGKGGYENNHHIGVLVSKPIVVAGVSFASHAALSLYLGYKKNYVNCLLCKRPDVAMERLTVMVIAKGMERLAKTECAARKALDREMEAGITKAHIHGQRVAA